MLTSEACELAGVQFGNMTPGYCNLYVQVAKMVNNVRRKCLYISTQHLSCSTRVEVIYILLII